MAYEYIDFGHIVSGNFCFQNHLKVHLYVFDSFLFLRCIIKMFSDLRKFHFQLRRSHTFTCNNNNVHDRQHGQFDYEALFYIIKKT